MGQEIRILLVDDRSLFRGSLRRLLQDDPTFKSCGAVLPVRDVLTAVVGKQVHIVLLAYDFRKEQASDFLEQAKKLGCDRVLATRGMSGSAVATRA